MSSILFLTLSLFICSQIRGRSIWVKVWFVTWVLLVENNSMVNISIWIWCYLLGLEDIGWMFVCVLLSVSEISGCSSRGCGWVWWHGLWDPAEVLHVRWKRRSGKDKLCRLTCCEICKQWASYSSGFYRSSTFLEWFLCPGSETIPFLIRLSIYLPLQSLTNRICFYVCMHISYFLACFS